MSIFVETKQFKNKYMNTENTIRFNKSYLMGWFGSKGFRLDQFEEVSFSSLGLYCYAKYDANLAIYIEQLLGKHTFDEEINCLVFEGVNENVKFILEL